MSLKMKKIFVSWCLSILLIFAVVTGAQAYSSVLALGDSLSDNGTSTSDPWDPFGIKRFSNGQVWVEYLAQNLGVSLYDMAYGGATSSNGNPAVSKTYQELYTATGNTDYALYASYFANNTGLQWQVGALAAVNNNDLVTISSGGNDLFNYASNPALYNPITAANNIATAIQNLIIKGGRNFLVMNLSLSQQSDDTQVWMTYFNGQLASNLSYLMALNSNIAGLDIDLLDMTKFVADVDNFTGTWKANSCANNPNDPNCTNETFAWWDTVGVHPTTEVHKQIGDYATAAVPEPASIILLILGFAGLIGARRRMK